MPAMAGFLLPVFSLVNLALFVGLGIAQAHDSHDPESFFHEYFVATDHCEAPGFRVFTPDDKSASAYDALFAGTRSDQLKKKASREARRCSRTLRMPCTSVRATSGASSTMISWTFRFSVGEARIFT